MNHKLQIQTERGWVTLAEFEHLFIAKRACDRAVLSDRRSARILEIDEWKIETILYESHYNPRLDPSVNWQEEFQEEQDDTARWQELGF